MFTSKRNKKGMTLIEMMAVIAIIAVLVGILVPIVNNATTRANAAANAANLRNVAGQVATLKVTEPEAFKGYDTANSIVTSVIEGAKNEVQRVKNGINDFLEPFMGPNAFDKIVDSFLTSTYIPDTWKQAYTAAIEFVDVVEYKYGTCQTFYAEDGKVNIGNTTITAPASKAISIDDFKLKKGTEMVIVVTDTNIYATYDGITVSGFATMAQDGDTTTTGNITHNYRDSNNNNACDLCGGAGGTDTCIKNTSTELDNQVNGHRCVDNSPHDHKCDDQNCGQPMPNSGCVDGDDAGHTCDYSSVCGNSEDVPNSCTPNSQCVCTQCNKTSHADTNKDHKCDKCSSTDGIPGCSHSGIGTGVCSYCGQKNDWWTGCPNC